MIDEILLILKSEHLIKLNYIINQIHIIKTFS